jgi:queuosine precursor transporter
MSSTLLIALYIACELIANITANKTITLLGMSAPGGVFIYALTFTLIDLVNEHFGKQGARRVIYAAFAANILFALYSAFIIVLPSPAFFTGQEAFARVLGSTPRIVAASLLAYIVSSLIDVEVFDTWKRKIGGYKWARVLASNAVSTAVDSSLFVALAFGGVLPLVPLIVGQYMFKMAITVVSVPLIYVTHSMKVEPAGK